MSNPRLSGQDTEVNIIDDGEPVLNVTAIKSMDMTWKFTIKEEDYIGETAPRQDEFFMGLSGRIEFDIEGIEAFNLIESIKQRAQNRTQLRQIGIKTTLQFPNGDRAIINIPDAHFSDIPVSFGGRTEYGRITLSYQAENGQIVSR